MRIVFGMQLDGSVWSDEDSSIGVVKTGPLGLLSILETRLGTGRELEHPVHRIDQYMKRLQLIDRESIWFHKSFSIDQWSTARQLLEWRDELVEAGWDGCAISSDSPRLAALVELESVESTLSYGQSDRLRSVIKSLKSNMPAHIESIILTEPLIMLPLIWQSVLELLKSQVIFHISNLKLMVLTVRILYHQMTILLYCSNLKMSGKQLSIWHFGWHLNMNLMIKWL